MFSKRYVLNMNFERFSSPIHPFDSPICFPGQTPSLDPWEPLQSPPRVTTSQQSFPQGAANQGAAGSDCFRGAHCFEGGVHFDLD